MSSSTSTPWRHARLHSGRDGKITLRSCIAKDQVRSKLVFSLSSHWFGILFLQEPCINPATSDLAATVRTSGIVLQDVPSSDNPTIAPPN